MHLGHVPVQLWGCVLGNEFMYMITNLIYLTSFPKYVLTDYRSYKGD